MGFGKKNTEVNCLHHMISRVCTVDMFMNASVDFDNLAEVMVVRFLY